MREAVAALAVLAGAAGAGAAVKTQVIEYEADGTKLKGYLAYNDAIKDKRPGVLVFHEFWGLNDYAKKRTEALAKMGYVAFAADLYGDGQVTEHPADAGKMAGAVRANVERWRGRAVAALKQLTAQETVDPKKVAAIGYCFGGTTALQLAYTGADVKAVVTFHAGIAVPTDAEAKAIKAKILVCHGAEDSFIKDETIAELRGKLKAAGVDYEVAYYGNAVHSFTVPDADKAGMKGIAYNEPADRRSWKAMKDLFDEVFAK